MNTRVVIPLVATAGVVAIIAAFSLTGERDRVGREREDAAKDARDKLAIAAAGPSNVVRVWEVAFQADPATSEQVPRSAVVQSDDGLCRLTVEERFNKPRQTVIDCPGLSIAVYREVKLQFDNRQTADVMRMRKSADSAGVAIVADDQDAKDGHLAYDEFLRQMTSATSLSVDLAIESAGKYAPTYSMNGSGVALARIGAIRN